MTVKADIVTTAVLQKKGNGISIEIDPEIRWSPASLLVLAEAVKGAAMMMLANQAG